MNFLTLTPCLAVFMVGAMIQPKVFAFVFSALILAACSVAERAESNGAPLNEGGGGGILGACTEAEPVCPRKSYSDCTPFPVGVFEAGCCANNGEETISMEQCALTVAGVTAWLTSKCPGCPNDGETCAIAADGTVFCDVFGGP